MICSVSTIQIEIAGRTAYKSLDKIEYDENGRSKTAKEFVDKMIGLGHGSPLEHGTIYLLIDYIDKELNVLINEVDSSYNCYKASKNEKDN